MRFVVRFALFLLTIGAGACTHVHPHERGKLAHPTMTAPLAGVAEEHVNAIYEGATGGSAAGGGGCGCN